MNVKAFLSGYMSKAASGAPMMATPVPPKRKSPRPNYGNQDHFPIDEKPISTLTPFERFRLGLPPSDLKPLGTGAPSTLLETNPIRSVPDKPRVAVSTGPEDWLGQRIDSVKSGEATYTPAKPAGSVQLKPVRKFPAVKGAATALLGGLVSATYNALTSPTPDSKAPAAD